MKQENRLVYVAEDGKVFERAWECMDYEHKYYLEKWNMVPKIELTTGITEGLVDEFYIVACSCPSDVDNANKYLGFMDEEKKTFLTYTDIGKRVLICLWADRQGCNRINYVEDELRDLAKQMLLAKPKRGGE